MTSIKSAALFLVLICSIPFEAISAPSTTTTESAIIINTTSGALSNRTSESNLKNGESSPTPTTSSNTIQVTSPSSITTVTEFLNNVPFNIGPTIADNILQDSTATTLLTTETPNTNSILEDLISMVFDEKIFAGIIYAPTTTTTVAPTMEIPISYQNLFANDLFVVIFKNRSQQNIVYSPVSIQTCLALAFMGAEGVTAENMRNFLRLGEGEKPDIAKRFGEFLKSSEIAENFKIVNRLYIKQKLNVSEEFNYFAKKYFRAQAEKLDFSEVKTSVQQINNWVAQQTDYKIKNLMSANSLSDNSNAVLINAIYFKSKWLNPFSLSSTSRAKFYITKNDSQDTEIMYNEAYYNYRELPELKATALEMPYENSNLSMLIILPNEIGGLEELESKVGTKNLQDITSKMQLKKVQVYLPRFSIEFDMDLKEPLEKLGLANIFSKQANFKGIFEETEFQSISEIKHKAYLDVNEAGSEAAAATFATLTALSAPFDEPTFRADHPFMFAIRSKTAVYFVGHVVSI